METIKVGDLVRKKPGVFKGKLPKNPYVVIEILGNGIRVMNDKSEVLTFYKDHLVKDRGIMTDVKALLTSEDKELLNSIVGKISQKEYCAHGCGTPVPYAPDHAGVCTSCIEYINSLWGK